MLSHIITYFSNWVFFPFLNKYDFIINLFVILYIFYKMTIWWIIDFLLSKLFDFLKNFFESRAWWWDKWGDWWEDDDKWHH